MMRAVGETRKGDWMETASGIRFYPLDPRAEEVDLLDIAHHLSRINRYNGAARLECYSVAEHSVLMATWLMDTYGDPRLAYQGLMHDASEAYIGDMVRPLKRNMPEFVAAEEPVWQAIVERFPVLTDQALSQGHCYDLDARVKVADNRILVDERAQVMRPSGNPWGIDHLEPLGVKIYGHHADLAKYEFLQAERQLRGLWEITSYPA